MAVDDKITFQRMWKVSVGQFINGGFNTVFEDTESRFVASIKASAKDTSGVETQMISTFKLYNIGYEKINILSNHKNLYIKVQADYLYRNGKRSTFEGLPTIYLGNIFYTNTVTQSGDVVTTMNASPSFEKATRSVCNLQFDKGVNSKGIFTRLANELGLPIIFFTNRTFKNLSVSLSVEGSTATCLKTWCDNYQLRNYIEHGRIYIVDKEVKHGGRSSHYIEAGMIKGSATVSVNLSKLLKEKTKYTPSISVNTFLFPLISLHDVVTVEVLDFTKEQTNVKSYIAEEFIIDKYEHKIDTHGSSWLTHMEGKGGV